MREIATMSFLVALLLLASAAPAEERREPVHGVYGHPKAFWETGAKLDEYGVNAVFVHGGAIDDALVERARAEGCKVYAEFATLNGGYEKWVEKHPDAHPIDDEGNPARKATWFMGVCPTNKEFRAFRMNALRELLTKYDLDGVFLDYLHWHGQFEDPYPQFIKTCFNDDCLSAFEQHSGVKVQGKTVAEKAKWIFANAAKQWEDWRVSVVVDWAREAREITKSIRPKALIGNYHVAWRDEDLSGIRRRALGVDLKALAEHVDVFAPMLYHGRSGKTPESVRDYVEWFGSNYPVQTEPGKFPQMWPIVQAHDEPRVSPEEFEKVLRYGLGGKSGGVMMFTTGSVAKDPGKMAAMRRVYTGDAQ
jgi:hypothetical protein